MDYKYQGYLGKETDSLKSLSRASLSYQKYKELEEEEQAKNKQLEESQIAAAQQAEDDKPWYQKVGDATAGVGSFVKDAAVDLYKTGENAIGGNANIVEGSVAANEEAGRSKRELEMTQATAKALQDKLGAEYDNPNSSAWDSKEVRSIIDRGNNDLAELRKSTQTQREGAQKQIEESQNVDTKKVAADTAETFLNIATLGTGAAAKQVAKQGIKLGVQTIKKQGGKEIAKNLARGAGEGAIFSGAAGLTDSVSEGLSAEDAVTNIAKSAAFGGLLGGASGGVGSALRVKANNKAATALDASNAKNEADIASVDTGIDDIVDGINNPLRDVSDADLRSQIDEFTDGGGRTDDVQADYARVQSVKDELSSRERNTYFAGGGLSKAEATKALDDFDSGNMPDAVYKTAEPVDSAVQVMARDDMPVQLKTAAAEVVQDRKAVEDQMFGLMSPEVKGAELNRLDESYDASIKQLQRRYSSLEKPVKDKDTTVNQSVAGQKLSGEYKTDVRFQAAKEKLDDQYRNDIAELDMLEAKDLEEVAKYQGMIDTLDRRDSQISNDANRFMSSSPDTFKDIDPAEMAAQRKLLSDKVSQAERFDDGKGIVTEAATSPDPVKSIENNPDGIASVRADIAESTANLEGFKNASGLRQAVLGILSPSKNFEAFGLRKLHDAIVVGDAKLQLANQADFERLKPIAKAINGNKDLQKQIVEYLEGGRQTLSATDVKTAEAIRSLLDEKKAWLNDNGFATMDDYFPHMFDVKNPETKRLFNAKTTGEIKFGNIKQRLSDSDDYSREIIDVLSTYTQGVNKKIHLEPTLRPLDDLKVMDKVTQMERDWLNTFIDQLKGTGKRSGLEKGFNTVVDELLGKTNSNAVGGNHYRAVLGGQRMISSVATMGINPGTALRNLTQVVNTVAGIGPKWSAVGMVHGTRALRAGKGSPEFSEMAEAGVFSGGISKNYNADLDEFSTNITGLKGKSNAVANKMMLMVSVTDSTMRAQAYWGAKAKALSKGMDEDAAKAFAREKVIDTQFVTSKVDMPTTLNGPGVRSLTQLATFSAKQAEFLAGLGVNLVKGKDGSFTMGRGEQAVNLLSAAAMAGTATAILEPVIGFNSEEFIPFYPQIAPFIPGANKEVSDALYRSPLVTLLAGDGKSRMGLVEAIQSGDPGEFLKDQWSSITPGGTQIKKSVEGFSTTNSGESRNSEGNIRYLQNEDGWSKFQASIFGQYSTEAGRDWIEEGFPTLSESQTGNVDAQTSRDMKEAYSAFYSARKKASGRQSAVDKMKEAALIGDNNKVSRLAKDFNDKVTESMAKYWNEHQELPEDLQDELLNDLYIDVNKVKENAKKN